MNGLGRANMADIFKWQIIIFLITGVVAIILGLVLAMDVLRLPNWVKL